MTGLGLPSLDLAGDVRRRPVTGLRSGAARALRGPASTAVLVEQAAAVGVAALRLSLVVQMVPALAAGTRLSPHPRAYLALWLVGATAALAGAVVTGVRRRPVGAPVVYVDVALAVVLLVLCAGVVPVEHRIGSWVGWTAGYALTVACTSGTLRPTRAWLLCLGAVVLGYLVYVAPLAAGPALPTVVANALGYVAQAATVRLIVWYLRRISGVADEARAEVARLARLEEEHRAQLAMHDATTVMQLLADPSLPPDLRVELQAQAVAEVRRMRSYLRREPEPATSTAAADGVDLRAVVAEACEGFGDLGLSVSTDLLDGVRVDAEHSPALVAALRTVLHNVRRHAGATRVVVHGDVEDEGSGGSVARWTVGVRDDGRGFDLARTPLGVGLRTQVVEELARHDVAVRIESHPGAGTLVELSGSVRP